MKNQYFQMEWRDDQAYLHFYPAEDGGQKLDIEEVTDYLSLRHYTSYDMKALNRAIAYAGKESEICVGAWDGNEIRESMKIRFSLDKMKAICRFYPPSPAGQSMDAREIIGLLNFHKIKVGIDQEKILQFLQEKKYCTDYVLANGLAPVHGKDAKIEYYFNTDRNLKPKHNDDGSVDYKELNTISHIKKGDLIARVIPEDPGKPGKNIFGEPVRPRTVKSAQLSYGSNITISEDRRELYSDVTGHAYLMDGKVFVSDVFEVQSDVDNTVGNIDYEGSVLIHGSVKSGFMVKANGDIIIEGDVEASEIISNTQIIVKQGIHGMYKGTLQAGTNVIARYIENANVKAGGFVEAETILNSDVAAGSDIRVHSKKGLIIGGIVRARNSIEADNLGTEMGTATVLEVGIAPEKKERYVELSRRIKELSQSIEDLTMVVSNYAALVKKGENIPQDKMLYVQKMAAMLKGQQEELEVTKEEMRQIYSEMLASDKSFVSVNGRAYPGVTIAISDLSYSVKEVQNHCKFKKQDNSIATVII